jgi:acyl-CoA thioesterase
VIARGWCAGSFARVPSRFALDTAVTSLGEGRYGAVIDPAWRVERANGGYVAAIVLRAVTTELADPARLPRSVTMHYLRPPDDGPVEVEVTSERTGRTMSALSARLTQGGRTMGLALVSAGLSRDGYELDEAPMPDVPPPEESEALVRPPFPIPIRDQIETRHAIGPQPFGPPGEAVTGGWMRMVEPEPTDAHVLVQMADAWVPAIFGVSTERLGVPTVDLTVHLRRTPTPDDDGWVLVRFRTRVAAEGFLEEDGEIWGRSGRLLAQSRQLAAILR